MESGAQALALAVEFRLPWDLEQVIQCPLLSGF